MIAISAKMRSFMPDCLLCTLYLCKSYEPVAHLQLRERAETKRGKGEAS